MSERSETNVGLTDLLDGWRRIADELPPLDTPVWLYGPSGPRVRLWIGERADDPDGWLWTDCNGSAYFADGAWTATDSEAEDYHPTHWRPLPQPPNTALIKPAPRSGVGLDELLCGTDRRTKC